jgi:uncharacterized membrane protein
MNEQRIHQFFMISVLLKGAHAVIECIGGIALALIKPEAIKNFVNAITVDELIEDPNDFIATHLLRWAEGFDIDTQHFYAFYLFSHGIVKVFLVAGLLRRQLWAYPASLVVLAIFIAYQLYRYSYTRGFGLIALSVFDVVVMWLVWHEYRLLRGHLATATK